MTINGLRPVSRRKYRITARGTYGQIVSIPNGTNLTIGDEVLMYSTEGGDVVVLRKQKKGRK